MDFGVRRLTWCRAVIDIMVVVINNYYVRRRSPLSQEASKLQHVADARDNIMLPWEQVCRYLCQCTAQVPRMSTQLSDFVESSSLSLL